MNYVAEDIKDVLIHYGMPRRSGRYPWGSGKNPYQHSADFLARVEELKAEGLSEKEIALDIYGKEGTTSKLRTQLSLAKAERRADQVATAKGLREKGYSLNQIAEKMGFANDSSVRSLLNEKSEERMNQARTTADFLKKMVDEKGMIDVGAGVEKELGNISKEKLKQALDILEMEGYPTYGGGLPQVTNKGKQTNLKVLCPPGTEHKDIYDIENVHSVMEYDRMIMNDGTERKSFEYPESLDISRLQIRYNEEGGIDQDGLIELRRGVPDLDLGAAHYAQVRIRVDGDRYLKGMAVYADDLPEGVDVRFNTNKHLGMEPRDVMKPIKSDPTNPFGSLIKEHGGQSYYPDPNGKFTNPITGEKESLSLINKRADEGDWLNWDNSHLSSQFLAKQSMELINKQLDLAKADKVAEFNEICSLTNPTIKRRLLESFANDCDSAAVHLEAAALPRQKYHVILPLRTIKDHEVYAPNYKNGEKVALVRYPHEGAFQIPILTVNNKNKEAQAMMTKNPKDAVGISKASADILSGADFDGDTVMVIPVGGKVKIQTSRLRDLEGFDTKESYGPNSPGSIGRNFRKMTKGQTQNEMGKISNLITDMTLQGAGEAELARATKHSMVVIDAEKHGLDYKRSFEENGIAALKKKYQGRIEEDGKYHEGVATLISRAKGQVSVVRRKGTPRINKIGKEWYDPSLPEGSLIYKTDPDATYVNKKGKTVTKMQKSTRMAETRDARTLISEHDTPKERAYATYANSMKALANSARKEMVYTGKLEYKASSKKAYANEVASLTAKLNVAEKNAPREREAQRIANIEVNAKKQANPDMTKAEIKKASQIAIERARTVVGSSRRDVAIDVDDREWEAIQAGAISDNQLSRMLKYVNLDQLRARATPRNNKVLSDAKQSQIKSMANSGYTNQEIAERLGVSTSTVSKYL